MTMYSDRYIELAKRAESLGHNIYDFTFDAATKELVDTLMKRYGIKRADAKNLVINSLIYNVVQEEIINQCDFILGTGSYEENDDDTPDNTGEEDCIKL